MNLLRAISHPNEGHRAEPAEVPVMSDELASAIATNPIASITTRGAPDAIAQAVVLLSHDPPLLMAAISQTAPALDEILSGRSFTVRLGVREARCRLHATADGGESAVLVGHVLSL